MTKKTIRELNDQFRKTGTGGLVLMTAGVANLEPNEINHVNKIVRDFATFTEENDPHGEHDFGSFDYKGVKFFWKIDYYSKDNMERGSEDPSDPHQTSRVLTIMFASEY